MSIKIAITAQNRKTISAHAGACRNFFIYTIEIDGTNKKELIELTKDQTLKYTFHEDESKKPKNIIFGMDVVLTQGIGLGGVKRLAKQDVIVHVIKEIDPDVAIQKYLERSLEFFEPENHHKKDDNHNCKH